MSSTKIVNGVGSGRTGWCGGGTGTTRTTYLDGSLYCPSHADGSQCQPPDTQCIHDIRDQEDFAGGACTGYDGTNGTLRNCNVVHHNTIYECETSGQSGSDTMVRGEVAGLDTDMGTMGDSNYDTFYFLNTDPVYIDNTYYADSASENLFGGPCGRQGSCGNPPLSGLLTFCTGNSCTTNVAPATWQGLHSISDNHGGQDPSTGNCSTGSCINQSDPTGNPCGADH